MRFCRAYVTKLQVCVSVLKVVTLESCIKSNVDRRGSHVVHLATGECPEHGLNASDWRLQLASPSGWSRLRRVRVPCSAPTNGKAGAISLSARAGELLKLQGKGGFWTLGPYDMVTFAMSPMTRPQRR